MAANSKVLQATSNMLREYLHTNDEANLVENFQKMMQSEAPNDLIIAFKSVLVEINRWNLEEAQSLLDQIISRIEDEQIKKVFKIFKSQLILLVFNRVIEKTDNIELIIQTLFNRIPIYNENLQISNEIQDERLINKYREEELDNYFTLGLFALYAADIQKAFQYFENALDLFYEKEDFAITKHASILRIISNLLLKIRYDPELVDVCKTILHADSKKLDVYQLAFKFINQAISLDQKEHNSSALATDYYNLALLLYERQMYKQAIQELKKAQEMHEALKEREGILDDLILLGTLFQKDDQETQAFQIYNQALNIASDLDNKYKIAELNLLLGRLCRDQHNFEESLKNLKTALFIFKQEEIGEAYDLIEAYSFLGQVLREMGKLEEAKSFLFKILEIEKKSQSKKILTEIYLQIAITNVYREKEDEFQKAYQKILSFYEEVKDHFHYSQSEEQIGIAFCNQQQYHEGLQHLEKALGLYHAARNELRIGNILQILSAIYPKINKSTLAAKISDENTDIITRTKYILETSSSIDLTIPKPPSIAPPTPSKPVTPIASPVDESILEPPAKPTTVTPSKPVIPIATPVDESILEPPAIPRPPSPTKLKPLPKIESPLESPIQDVPPPSEVKPAAPAPPEIMKFIGRICPQCGFMVTDSSFLFCPKCATKLETARTCQKCGFKVENPEFRFCPKCATTLE
ncbi:MAG TPA: tetratricopeptide repeat protein [Candidatus Deferrimicrobium sp.]|nr:tetratricopeptide repeat protein [Candidatus Deferrimicrobium sp.]